MRKLTLEAWTVADNYDVQIRELRKEIAEQVEQWKVDLKGIVEKYRPAEDERKHHQKGGKVGEKHKGEREHRRRKKGRKRHFGMKKMFSPVGFMLFDSDCEKGADEEDEILNKVGFEDDFEGDGSLVFPNPSNNFNVLQFSVKKAGNIKVDLYDKDGKFIRTLSDETGKSANIVYVPIWAICKKAFIITALPAREATKVAGF